MADEARLKNPEAFDRIVRALTAAIKSSALYPSGHPSLVAAITTLRQSLEGWFASTNRFDLGIAPDTLLINGEYPKQEADRVYAEVGGYLHQRGLVSVSVEAGVTDQDLECFFRILKAEPKAYASQGGIAKQISSCRHIAVREVDYAALLRSRAGDAAVDTERDVWRTLVTASGAGAGGELPVSKVEFLNDFLANPERSANVLNKVYREALARVDDNATVDMMRSAFLGIAKYYDEHPSRNAREVRKDIADLIIRLDPVLVAKLFESGSAGGVGAALSDEIMGALPDDTVADFIASLVGREGAVNSRLLKFFDKLVADDGRAANMTALVADKLFDLSFIDRAGLSKLQGSIQEMFKADPGSRFLSEMYKMTIETFVDASSGSAFRSDDDLRVSREASEALKYDSLRRQEVRLLLNLIALESDGVTFARLCDILTARFDAIVDVLYIQAVRETFELFLAKLDVANRPDCAFAEAAAGVVQKITAVDVIGRIVSLIRDSGPFELNNISRIIAMTQPVSCRLVVDAFSREAEEIVRDRFSHVITAIGAPAVGELRRCIAEDMGRNAASVLPLFDLIKRIDPAEAGAAARLLLTSKNDRVVGEALHDYIPRDAADAEPLLAIMREAEGRELGERALAALVRSHDRGLINRLFRAIRRKPLSTYYLLGAVKLCGDLKILEAEGALKETFSHAPFFYTRSVDEVRVACLVSLAQLGTEESMKSVRQSSRDRSDGVRRMGAILLELDAKSRAAQPKEASDGGRG